MYRTTVVMSTSLLTLAFDGARVCFVLASLWRINALIRSLLYSLVGELLRDLLASGLLEHAARRVGLSYG